jgi:hypothetical protein
MGLRHALQPVLHNVLCLWVTSQTLAIRKCWGQLRNFDSPVRRTFAFNFPFKSSNTRYGRPLLSSSSTLVLPSLNNRHHFLTFHSFARPSLSTSAIRLWIAIGQNLHHFYVHMTVHRDMWPCIVTCDRASWQISFIIKPTRCTNFTNLFWHELLHVSGSSSAHHQECIHCNSALIYVIQVCRQWIHSWWWAEELSKTCRISCQNKFVKLVHLVGFIRNEICHDARSHVTMHGHMSRCTVICHDARLHERKNQVK